MMKNHQPDNLWDVKSEMEFLQIKEFFAVFNAIVLAVIGIVSYFTVRKLQRDSTSRSVMLLFAILQFLYLASYPLQFRIPVETLKNSSLNCIIHSTRASLLIGVNFTMILLMFSWLIKKHFERVYYQYRRLFSYCAFSVVLVSVIGAISTTSISCDRYNMSKVFTPVALTAFILYFIGLISLIAINIVHRIQMRKAVVDSSQQEEDSSLGLVVANIYFAFWTPAVAAAIYEFRYFVLQPPML